MNIVSETTLTAVVCSVIAFVLGLWLRPKSKECDEVGLTPQVRSRIKAAENKAGMMQAKAEALWGLLDDIDTASDMFKPSDDTSFRAYWHYACRKVAERFIHLESDGYDLFIPGTMPRNKQKKHRPMRFNEGGGWV